MPLHSSILQRVADARCRGAPRWRGFGRSDGPNEELARCTGDRAEIFWVRCEALSPGVRNRARGGVVRPRLRWLGRWGAGDTRGLARGVGSGSPSGVVGRFAPEYPV